MNAEYKKAAEKLLCGITDKRLHEPAIWNDILSSARSGNLQLWEINDEILRIKYFCKEKTERASAFTESNKSGVRFDDLNAYFVEAIKSRDKGYFEAFIRAYEPVLQSRAERFVSHYNLSADDTEDIKQIFLETLWFAFLGYTPYGDGKAGEILYTAAGKYRFQLIRLAEFDATGAYAEQAAKIIDNMNGNFIKERFYAIPLESLPRVNSHNAKPRMPFYHPPHTDGQK